MAKLSISKAWDDARPIIARDGRLMFIVALATVVVPGTLLYLLFPEAEHSEGLGASILTLLFSLLSIIGSIAISYLALYRGASVGDALRRGLRRLLATIAMALLLLIPLIVVFAILLGALLGFDQVAELSDTETIDPAAAGSVGIVLILFVAIMIFLGVRLSVTTPVIAAENVGPLGIVKRSWSLTRGHFLRILGFILLFAIGALVFMMAVGLVSGLAVQLALGDPEPMSVAALVGGLISTLAQAALTIVFSTIVARIYLQLAGEPADPAVPHHRPPEEHPDGPASAPPSA